MKNNSCRFLKDCISGQNAASLNLHIKIAGNNNFRIDSYEDQYIRGTQK